MAELNFNSDDITAALRKNLEGYSPQTETARVGRIIEVGDGIARVSGLPGAAVNELLAVGPGPGPPGPGPWVAGAARSVWPSTSTRTRSAPSCSARSGTSRRASRSR